MKSAKEFARQFVKNNVIEMDEAETQWLADAVAARDADAAHDRERLEQSTRDFTRDLQFQLGRAAEREKAAVAAALREIRESECEMCATGSTPKTVDSEERGVFWWHEFGNLSRECTAPKGTHIDPAHESALDKMLAEAKQAATAKLDH